MAGVAYVVSGANAAIQRIVNVGPGKNLRGAAQVGNIGLRGSRDVSDSVAHCHSNSFAARTADRSSDSGLKNALLSRMHYVVPAVSVGYGRIHRKRVKRARANSG